MTERKPRGLTGRRIGRPLRLSLVVALTLVLSSGALSGALPTPLPGGTPTLAFAASEALVHAEDSITLSPEQTEFTIPLTIEHPSAFAGVEVAVQCGEGVDISAVTYDVSSSQAGPVDARGLTWFAVFSGSNRFSGTMTATINATYAGDTNASIVIDHASFYAKDGSVFTTDNLALRKTITINRQGANNTPEPLEPPRNNETGSAPAGGGNGTGSGTAPGGGAPGGGNPGGGNPPSGALVAYAPPTNSTAGGAAGAAAGGVAGSTGNATAGTPAAGAAGAAQNSVGGGGGDATTSLSSGETPLTAGDSNSIPAGSSQQTNSALLSIAVICLA
ncbi:MAG: hypothetical protein LBP24_05295, partial [Coriobacteriales bacterium]|nr:hypothetical protein [Coriobacteriales bacterium]